MICIILICMVVARLHVYFYLFVYLSIYLSVCLSVCIYLSIYLSIYLYIYLYLSQGKASDPQRCRRFRGCKLCFFLSPPQNKFPQNFWMLYHYISLAYPSCSDIGGGRKKNTLNSRPFPYGFDFLPETLCSTSDILDDILLLLFLHIYVEQ